jgi:hypothetical protein
MDNEKLERRYFLISHSKKNPAVGQDFLNILKKRLSRSLCSLNQFALKIAGFILMNDTFFSQFVDH